MSKMLLKLIIFIIIWGVGSALFSGMFGGSASDITGIFFVGQQVLGSSLQNDADGLITLIFSFIITTAVYYLIAEIITFIIYKIF